MIKANAFPGIIPLLLGSTASLLLYASPLFGQEVTAIIGQDLPIYRQALKGFRKVYTGGVREFDLKGNPNRIHQLRESTQDSDKEIILAVGLMAAKAAKEAYAGTPTVFCMVFNPERFSLKGKLSTGVSMDIPPSLILREIKTLFPEVGRIGILYDPEKNQQLVDTAWKAAKSQGVALLAEAVRSEKMLSKALENLEGKIDFLWIAPDSTVVTPRSIGFIFLQALRNEIPIVTFSEALVRRGAVAAFSPDYASVGEEAGRLVLQILKGKRPDQIPLRNAVKARLILNLKMARKLGVRLGPNAVNKADKVYE
ncbi:MAG: ABC transporter substrate-binding protein [Nitrospiria bacterium]